MSPVLRMRLRMIAAFTLVIGGLIATIASMTFPAPAATLPASGVAVTVTIAR